MKRPIIIVACMALMGVLAWTFAQVASRTRPELASLVPPGSLLYLEAKDFSALLKDWNGSGEKKLWLGSDSYQVFSRSRLFLRLNGAQTEFAAAAGVAPDMDLLNQVAGSESAIAFYDIGGLEFLYITRLPAARIASSGLWSQRGKYQTRQSAGLDYYVHTDTASHRVAAFASSGDYLFVATREDAIAGALALFSGKSAPSLKQEAWFADSARAAGAQPGELRLVMNFERLLLSPHFRSYWVQRNTGDLKQYSAGLSDLNRTVAEFRESRVFLRATPADPAAWNEAAVAQVLRLAPPAAGLVRAWASPDQSQVTDLIWRRILAPHISSVAPSRSAPPPAALGDGAVGDEGDLETRIDEPPIDVVAGGLPERLQRVLATRIEAALQISGTRTLADGVFLGTESAAALLAASDWDAAAVRDALLQAAAGLWSVDASSVHWNERTSAGIAYQELDDIAPLALAVNGRLLIVADRRELLESILAGIAKPAPAEAARYVAFYNHARELPNFLKLTGLIDSTLAREGPPEAREPAFFSENIGSLGKTLGRVESESLRVHDTGNVVSQTLIYKLKP
ncbi:MAG: hypothetical protein M3O35_18285 [Acidobacteriota bacterium]|nr:hypothetical protein [Acidobacteriota bacterium]